MPNLPTVKVAKELHKERLLSMPNVVGVATGYKTSQGQTTNQLSVVALVEEKIPLAELSREAVIPKTIDGIQIDVVAVGKLHALQNRTDRWRPVFPGVSIGHSQVTAGTFGCLVYDARTGVPLILSNNHILANNNQAATGDFILQPGPADGGKLPQDSIAYLLRFVPIHYGAQPVQPAPQPGCLAGILITIGRFFGAKSAMEYVSKTYGTTANTIDAALARPIDLTQIQQEIIDIGKITGTVEPALGMPIRKSGRSSGTTSGTISLLNATVNIQYPGNRTARFDNQVIATPMSQGGDSGAIIMAANSTFAVGLLFAGSGQSTVFSPIQMVLDQLEIRF